MKFSNTIKNQSGQVAVEYILLTVVLVGIFLSARAILIESNSVGNFVQKPWGLVAGMIESGVWKEPAKARQDHPAFLRRHLSFEGNNDR